MRTLLKLVSNVNEGHIQMTNNKTIQNNKKKNILKMDIIQSNTTQRRKKLIGSGIIIITNSGHFVNNPIRFLMYFTFDDFFGHF